MKSKVPQSRKLLFKSLGVYTGILCAVILFFFGIKILFSNVKSSLPIYNPSVPAETVKVDEPFKSQVYFNNVLEQITFLDKVVDMINQSQKSLEIAMFSMDSKKVIDAIYKADKRGVKVTLVLDQSRAEKHDISLANMPSTIKRVDAGTYSPTVSTDTTYMHHKFVLADRGESNEKLLTGSMDFTAAGEKYQQSFYMITPDHTLIGFYGKLFDILKQGISGSQKFNNTAYNPWLAHIQYSDTSIDLWSSPGFNNQSVKYKILDLIKNSKVSIKVMMWQFNDQDIARALVKQAQKGVRVSVIGDDLTVGDGNSVLPYLQKKAANEAAGNLTVVLDTKSLKLINRAKLPKNFNPFVHQHDMIVDGKILVFGTNNWTEWGFRKNDEDTMITDNAYLVNEFDKTFEFLLGTLK